MFHQISAAVQYQYLKLTSLYWIKNCPGSVYTVIAITLEFSLSTFYFSLSTFYFSLSTFYFSLSTFYFSFFTFQHSGSVYTVIAITLERFSTLRSSGRDSKVKKIDSSTKILYLWMNWANFNKFLKQMLSHSTCVIISGKNTLGKYVSSKYTFRQYGFGKYTFDNTCFECLFITQMSHKCQGFLLKVEDNTS